MSRVLERDQLAVLSRTAFGTGNRIHPVPGRILAGHQTGPTGGAIGSGGIRVHKNHPVFRQLVDMRALVVFRAHVTEIRPPHVVDKEEHDVGLGRKRSQDD